jgi:hypothetical protein
MVGLSSVSWAPMLIPQITIPNIASADLPKKTRGVKN